MSKYSEGSWGLSVQVRVAGIFTGTAISPSPGRRQCRSRYTIRAGRNLPDKEFRYLRTVIVTAAVYRGFDSGPQVRKPAIQEWYPTGDSTKPDGLASQSPTYPVHNKQKFSIKLQ